MRGCTQHTQHNVQQRLSAQNIREDDTAGEEGDGDDGNDRGDDFVNVLLKTACPKTLQLLIFLLSASAEATGA